MNVSNSPKQDNLIPSSLDAQPTGLPFREYFQVIQKRLWTIVLVTVMALGLGALYLVNQEPVYEAAAEIQIRTETPQVLGRDMEPVIDPVAGARYWSTEEYYQTQYRIIESRSVAQEVVRALQLDMNLDFLGIDPEATPEERARALADADPVERLRGMMRVAPVSDSQSVRIVVRHTNPEFAAQVADTVARVYIARNERQQLRGTTAAFDWLESERHELRTRVEDAEQEMLDFRREHGIQGGSIADRQRQLTDRLNSLNELLDAATAELDAVNAERRRVRRARDAEDIDEVAVPAVIENPLVQSLK
ncbi:MAG: hypothetical protein KC561_07040, partial [Myxococcales bacterium]|nr:hypothetical protein [Myxococcales bacterium]